MIVVNILGGLGNQMFQYSAGRALAESHGVPLRLDIRLFAGYCLHSGFELHRVFTIDAATATNAEIKKLIGWRATRIGRRLLADRRLSCLKGKHYYTEDGFTFNEEVISLPADCYLSGYWQSERYFKTYEPLIREQFRFKPPLSGNNEELAELIGQSSGAVSLHIRRGDYINNPKANAAHGACTIGYYEKAMRYIEAQVKGPVYFVFSDDVGWVRENLSINDQKHYFVNHNEGLESYNDMRLMSLCKHHIIANSSFSWWGAWLNRNNDKIVVAPDQWFQNPEWNSLDHVPSSWIRL